MPGVQMVNGHSYHVIFKAAKYYDQNIKTWPGYDAIAQTSDGIAYIKEKAKSRPNMSMSGLMDNSKKPGGFRDKGGLYGPHQSKLIKKGDINE